MKKFIGAMLLMCVFSLTQSFGYAIPDDAKIEKVSKTEVYSVDLVAVEMAVVLNSKIAHIIDVGFLASAISPHYNKKTNDLLTSGLHDNFKDAGLNKSNKTFTIDTRHNLPMKVGWRNENKNV